MTQDRYLLDEIRRAINTISEIGSYVELKKSGSRWKGLCPFHREKTPSFYVDETLGLFKCFGCGKGGDIFTFVMEMERVSFPEALEILARKAGITLPESRKDSKEPRSGDVEDVLKSAAEFFHRSLHAERAGVRDYLTGRNFGEEIWNRWRIGWSPGGSNLYRYLHGRIPEPLLLQTGLIQVKGNDRYDFFRERVMIPLYSPNGRIVGFSGRMLREGQPKYINSKETRYFQKSRLPYGYHLARREASSRGEWLVVEGYFDCIRLHEAGFSNAVATMGTALTVHHGELMKRVTPKALLCFDGDAAGMKAASAAIPLLLSGGLDVDVLFLPGGLDPDDYVAQKGGDGFSRFIAESRRSFLDFLFDREFPDGVRKLSPLDKTLGIQKILQVLQNVKDDMLRYEYLNRLSGRVDVPLAMLNQKIQHPASSSRSGKGLESLPDMERSLLGLLLENPSLQDQYSDRIHPDLFQDEDNRRVAEWLTEIIRERGGVDISVFRNHLIERGGDLSLLSHMLFAERSPELADTYVSHLEYKFISRELKRVQKLLEHAGNEEVKALLQEKQRLSSLLLNLKKHRESGS